MTFAEKLIKNKLGLLELANYLRKVSEFCRVIGNGRDTFYRVRGAYEEGGIEALKEKSKRPANLSFIRPLPKLPSRLLKMTASPQKS